MQQVIIFFAKNQTHNSHAPMTQPELLAQLETNFQTIRQFLQTVSPDDWARPQGQKWSIAEETAHLLNATQGTAFLFSPAGRATWRPTDRASLTYEEICENYRQALATRNPAIPASANTDQPRPDQQAQTWQAATQLLLNTLHNGGLSADLGRFTVWKHPLLGPLTAREMLYFTNYHTERHIVTLRAKQTMAD
jgi:hypothetical protein